MSDPFDPRPNRGFRDLVPWADPYIAALIEKLRDAEACDDERLRPAVGELPPPLDSDNGGRDNNWQADWSTRNWPRRAR